MLIVRYCTEIQREFVQNRPNCFWVYLGRDRARITEGEKYFSSEKRLDIAEMLHECAAEIRQSYLDLIAELGAIQKDRLGWWSSSLAWKLPTMSDFFQLFCYRMVMDKIARATGTTTNVLVFIEDPWLYRLALKGLPGRADRMMDISLLLIKSRLLMRGFAARIRWLLRTSRSCLIQRFYSRHRSSAANAPDILLYSFPLAKNFIGLDGWKDPYLGELDQILSGERYSVQRFTPVGAYGFEREIALRASYMRPMALYVTIGGLWHSFLAFWNAKFPATLKLNGIDVTLLLQREWWVDIGYARWCEHHLFFECAIKMLSHLRPSAVIYPFENWPWEKMLLAACRSAKIVSLGHQHSIVPKYMMPQYLGRGEADQTPLPDKIITAGPRQRDILLSGGIPASRLQVGGSLRNGYLRKAAPAEPASRGPLRRILAVASLDRAAEESLVTALEHAFQGKPGADGIALFLRRHPMYSNTLEIKHPWLSSVYGELSNQLPSFDAVVAVGTSVALEARMLGIPTVLLRPETTLDFNDLSNLTPNGVLLHASKNNLRERLLNALNLGVNDLPGALESWRDSLFSPVDKKTWLECLPPPRPPDPCRVPPKFSFID